MLVWIYSHFHGQTWEGEVTWPEGVQEDNDQIVLECIFRYFNRVDEDDAERLNKLGFDMPSLSMGDEVGFNGKRWRCEAIGWSQIGEVS